MQGNLAREEHLSPRGVQADYENINTLLSELDQQLAAKMKKMNQDDLKVCASKL